MNLFNQITSRFKLSETKQKIFKNIYWAVLGKVVTLLGGLIVGIFVARYLGPEQYGLMNYIISYVSIFSILAGFGMDNIEIRELSKTNEDKNKIIGTAFYLKIFFAVITVILVVITTLIFKTDFYTKLMIGIYSLSVILNSFNVIRNYFTSIVLNEYIVKTEISRTLIGAGIKILLLFLHAPLAYFIIATLFDGVLIAGGYLFSYREKVGKVKDWKFDRHIAKYLIRQSFPLLLSGAAIIIYQRIDQVMIGNMIDKASVGQFSVAGRFSEIAVFIPTIMAQTIAPILVRINESDKNAYKIKAQLFMNFTVWSSIILAILISIFSYWIILFTFGQQYIQAAPVLQIMSFKTIGIALSVTGGQLIIIEHLQKYAFIRNMLGAILCIILNYILIPSLGIIGSAIVSIISVLFSGTISNILILPYHHILKMQLNAIFTGWKDIFRIKNIFQ
ncbi:MAG: flippase [Paludibacter sp.]|nr:flippase [Paludibacter sp.]